MTTNVPFVDLFFFAKHQKSIKELLVSVFGIQT